MADKDLLDMTDDELNARRFATIQRICDHNNLPYPPELSVYLLQRERDGRR